MTKSAAPVGGPRSDFGAKHSALLYGIIGGVGRGKMAEILEQIGKMSVNEQVRVLEYLCTMLVPHYTGETPGWHGDVLRETEARVAAGEDRFMSLEESKRLFGEMVHAH